jgi:DNA-binding NtrC family response regulator
VREMENVVDRALILADEGHVTCADLPPQIVKAARAVVSEYPVFEPGQNLREQVRKFESAFIYKAIGEADGDRRVAAQKLGIGLSSLYRKLEEYEALGLLPSGAAAGQEASPG